MKKPTTFTRRSRIPAHSIEALESRIAPANVVLPAGTGPFTLQVSQTTSTLVITNGSANVIFDQGTQVGDDLSVTGGGAADLFFILNTPAGSPTFSGILDINVDCRVVANATLSAQQVHIAAEATLQLNGSITSTGQSSYSAPAGINVAPAASISSTTGDVVFHSDDDGNSDGPIIIGNAASITAGSAGSIFLDGNGPGFAAYGNPSVNSGIQLNGTLTTSGGNISLDGHGWNGGNGAQSGIGVAMNNATLTTTAGSIFVSGLGGNSAASGNVGIQASATTITTVAGTNIVISGQGQGTGTGEMGVRLMNNTSVHAQSPIVVNVFGTGQTGADGTLADNYGVSLETGSSVTTVDTGTVAITAIHGQSSVGLSMQSSALPGALNRLGFNGTNNFQGSIAIQSDSVSLQDHLLSTGGTLSFTPMTGGNAISINLGGPDTATTLGLSAAELSGTSASQLTIGDVNTGTIIVSAPIVTAVAAHVRLTNGGSSDIAFAGSGSINSSGGDCTIDAGGALVSGTATTDIVANTLTIKARGAIGSNANPLVFSATTLNTDTAATNSDQFLQTPNTVNVGSLFPGTGTVNLVSGTFVAISGTVTQPTTNVTVNGTLDVNGFNLGFNALNGAGTILNNGAAPSTLEVTQRDGIGIFSGKIQDGGGVLSLIVNGQGTGAGSQTLTGLNTYSGTTEVKNQGVLIIGTNNALPATTMLTLNEGVLNLGSRLQTIAGLDVGTGDILGTGTLTVTGTMMSSYANIFVKLAGNTGFTKYGIGDTILFNSKNTFTGPVTINGGTLEVHSNGALGDLTNDVIINDATLVTKGSFATSRNIIANGAAPTVNILSGAFTINGSVTGTGTLMKTGAGTLLFGNAFTGTTTVASGFVTVAATKVGITGNGTITITVVPDGMGGTRISTVELADTDATTLLAINGPKAPATTIIDTIKSLDPNDEIGTVKLGKTVIIGNGVNDAIADVDIRGKVNKLLFNDVNSYALFELGKGLPYNNIADDTTPDTYNNHPDIKLRNVLGTGVILDITGNGIAGDQPGSIGGGGLGKVIVNQWDQPGLVKTTQSIGQFKFKHGDCNVVFEVDKDEVGALTTAGIGKMLVPNGAWGSSGSIVEGNVTVFSAGQFLAAANITAGSMTKLLVKKGSYLGTTTLKNPDAPALGTFSVNGDYLGYVDSAQAMINLNIKGAFKGSLKAKSIGSISAYSFNGTTTGDGEGDPLRHNIFVTDGSLGTVKTSAGGIKDFEIAVATVFNGFYIQWPTAPGGAVGIDNVTVAAGQINNTTVNLALGVPNALSYGIKDSVFESAGSIGNLTSSHSVSNSIFAATTNMGNVSFKADLTGSKLLAGTSLGGDGVFDGDETYTREGKIGNVTALGTFGTTSIAVGVDPGAGFIYGDGDDIAAPGVATLKALGALTFGAASGGIFGPAGIVHTDAIEAATIKSLKVGTTPILKTFATSHYIRAGGSEVASDVLVKIV